LFFNFFFLFFFFFFFFVLDYKIDFVFETYFIDSKVEIFATGSRFWKGD